MRKITSPDKKDWPLVAGALAVAAVVLFIRLRLLNIPLERDEGEYAYAAQLFLKGLPPFVHCYTMKFPGTHLIYALFLALFGPTIWGIHMGLLLVNAASAVVLAAVGSRLFNVRVGVSAAAAFLILSASPSFLGLAAHATHFVAFFGLAGTLALIEAMERRRVWLLFGSGLLFACAAMAKQHGLFFGLFGVSVWVINRLTNKNWVAWRREAAFFLSGWVLPFLVIAAYVHAFGVLREFWFWTVVYGGQYAARITLADGWELFRFGALKILKDGWPFVGLAVFGIWRFIANREGPLTPLRTVPLLFLIFSALTVIPGFLFREHYFIPLIPAIALFFGYGIEALRQGKGKAVSPALLGGTLLVLSAGVAAHMNRSVFFLLKPEDASRAIYGANPFPESIQLGAFFNENSGPDDRLAVLGSEPQIFFYADRISATGFIYTYPLMENQPFAREMQRQMANEIEQANPRFLATIGIRTSWLTNPQSDTGIFDWAEDFIDERYAKIGLIEIQPTGSNHYWGEQLKMAKPESPFLITVYQRKSPPASDRHAG